MIHRGKLPYFFVLQSISTNKKITCPTNYCTSIMYTKSLQLYFLHACLLFFLLWFQTGSHLVESLGKFCCQIPLRISAILGLWMYHKALIICRGGSWFFQNYPSCRILVTYHGSQSPNFFVWQKSLGFPKWYYSSLEVSYSTPRNYYVKIKFADFFF